MHPFLYVVISNSRSNMMAGSNTQLSPLSGKETIIVCIRGSQMGLMQHDIVLT